ALRRLVAEAIVNDDDDDDAADEEVFVGEVALIGAWFLHGAIAGKVDNDEEVDMPRVVSVGLVGRWDTVCGRSSA
ncbi:MAG: hypothetical protein Q9166_006311, partial [cf. Caloplaca sp. 2 TL-2023]